MDEDMVIIPARKKSLSIINRKSITIGIGIGLAIAVGIGMAFASKKSCCEDKG